MEAASFIQNVMISESCVQGVIVTGSVARGTARNDSDIDAVIFLEPFDLYAIPAEFKWRREDGTFHGIFSDVKNSIQFDFMRLDLQEWSKPAHVWPESLCAGLCEGWLAFDRSGQIQKLIADRTCFRDEIRQERLDDAVVHLDWLLGNTAVERTWDMLGAAEAHSRLHAAYDYLMQAVFAYNCRWRTLPGRDLSDVAKLPWLPGKFTEQVMLSANALSRTKEAYLERATLLNGFFNELVTKCLHDGIYLRDPVHEAFIRRHDEPGRDWNMAEWNEKHGTRKNMEGCGR